MKILIFGLPGSGKSTLAQKLASQLNLEWVNANEVREQYNDWDFSSQGRKRQAQRMLEITKSKDNVVVDFVCPYQESRDAFNVDVKIWMNTIEDSRFYDTNHIFEIPNDSDTVEIENWSQAEKLLQTLVELETQHA